MSIQAYRGRLPLVVLLLLAVICLALLGFACACLTDHPMQALERAIAAIPLVPAVIEIWSAVVALLAAATWVSIRRPLESAPSPAALQRFLL